MKCCQGKDEAPLPHDRVGKTGITSWQTLNMLLNLPDIKLKALVLFGKFLIGAD